MALNQLASTKATNDCLFKFLVRTNCKQKQTKNITSKGN